MILVLIPPPLHHWHPRTLPFSIFFKHIKIFSDSGLYHYFSTRASPNHLCLLTSDLSSNIPPQRPFPWLPIWRTSSAPTIPSLIAFIVPTTLWNFHTYFNVRFLSISFHENVSSPRTRITPVLFTSKSQWLEHNLVHCRRWINVHRVNLQISYS